MKRYHILDIQYKNLNTTINKKVSKGWTVYRMDNLYKDCRYKVFFTKDLEGEELEKFDSVYLN